MSACLDTLEMIAAYAPAVYASLACVDSVLQMARVATVCTDTSVHSAIKSAPTVLCNRAVALRMGTAP